MDAIVLDETAQEEEHRHAEVTRDEGNGPGVSGEYQHETDGADTVERWNVARR